MRTFSSRDHANNIMRVVLMHEERERELKADVLVC